MSKPPEGASLLHINVPQGLLRRLDDFRFKNKFPSRTEALKWLIDWALKQKPSVAKSGTEEE